MEKVRVEMKASPSSKPFLFFLNKGFMQDISLTAINAFLATQRAKHAIFSIMGPMIIAILLGMSWKAFLGYEAVVVKGILNKQLVKRLFGIYLFHGLLLVFFL